MAALLLGPRSPQAIPPHIPSASISRLGRGPAGGRGAGPAGGAARGSRRKRRCRGGARRARGAAMPGRKSSKEKKRRRSRSCCPEGAPGPDGSDRKRRSTESSHGALEVARAESRGLASAMPPQPSRARPGPASWRQRPGRCPCRGWLRDGPGSVALVGGRREDGQTRHRQRQGPAEPWRASRERRSVLPRCEGCGVRARIAPVVALTLLALRVFSRMC